jgi:putative membrane protein
MVARGLLRPSVTMNSLRTLHRDSAFAELRGQFRGHLIPLCCLIAFLAVWTAIAVSPRYRDAWMLENIATAAIVLPLVFTYRRFRFSDRAYIQGTIFAILHTIASGTTYSEAPIGAFLQETFAWSRNHFDRVVHFSFGLLALRPMVEWAFRRPRAYQPGVAAALEQTGALARERGPLTRGTELALSLMAIGFFSGLYEIVEWITTLAVNPDAGAAFLGVQGDEWDAQKDMAVAMLGAALAVVVEVGLARRRRVR